MEYFYFWMTLLHVLSGMLFVGLPTMAWVGVCWTGARGWSLWSQCLWQSVLAGVVALASGLLLAGFKWDDTFDQAWIVVGGRWVFLFWEFVFSVGLIFGVAAIVRQWPSHRWQRWLAGSLMFLAATNSLYHFPALMVVSREIRLRPEIVDGLEGAVVRQLLFSPEILFRWIHVALASWMLAAVWGRFLVGMHCDEVKAEMVLSASKPETGAETSSVAQEVDQAVVERVLVISVWSGLIALALSGLGMLLHIDPARLGLLLTLGTGKSNGLMIGALCGIVVGLRTLFSERSPTGLSRFLEVGLMIAATAAMLV